MGLLATLIGPLADLLADKSLPILILTAIIAFLSLSVVFNVLAQVLLKDTTKPPVVFHWVPFLGSTVTYGIDPIAFFQQNQQKYGDIFTFVLLGRRNVVYLGPKGNEFILNGKLKDLCAEEIYSPLTTPIFGKDVVYDCPNSKLMEQKKFVKFGLTTEAFRSYVSLISDEVHAYVKRAACFKGDSGTIDVTTSMSQLTIFTASRALQGKEVRDMFDESFADLYHDLDQGFTPYNFLFPRFPFPQNRRRDIAHQKMVDTYTSIIRKRKEAGGEHDEQDMIWNLMQAVYKNGTPIPEHEIAHMMIALLMAGQHSSSSTITWIILHLADRPDVTEELLAEQRSVLGEDLPPLQYEDLSRLPLHAQVVKETLRMHSPIHSIMRKVKVDMPVDGSAVVVPKDYILMASPIFSGMSPNYFPNPKSWEPHRWDEGNSGVALEKSDLEGEEKTDYGYGLVTKGASSPYLPFGAGRHRCIGEQFAYVQLTTVLANMVRIFKFNNLPGKTGVVAPDYTSLFSRPTAPANVRWEKREKA